MNQRVEFFVPGIPQPGGSKRAIPIKNRYTGKWVTSADGRPIVNVVDANPRAADWKAVVSIYARQAWIGKPPMQGPLAFSFTFVMPRPKGHFGSGKNASVLKASAPPFPDKKPDPTKLTRSTEDAITGIIWEDDSQVVKQMIAKEYGATPGAQIAIWPMQGRDMWDLTRFCQPQSQPQSQPQTQNCLD